jgi:hypothetical protein
MSNEQNITNRRFNFNKNSKHIVSNSQNFLDKPINMNVQNINNNEINYNNDNNENNNKDNQRKLPKIINSIDGKGRNPYYFNKTSGIIGFNKGISYNSLKDLSENNNNNNNNPQSKFKRLKIIEKKNSKEKKDLIEENNDSFIDELTDILNNVNNNKNKNINQQQIILEDSKDNLNNSMNDEENKSEDDIEPDPRINFEHINQLNQKRPQTSYGGLNTRRKNLQTALQGKQNYNQPHFTNYFNFPNFNHNYNK